MIKKIFTLIELLAAIAIIAILCSLLFPDLAIFRKKTETATSTTSKIETRPENDGLPSEAALNQIANNLTEAYLRNIEVKESDVKWISKIRKTHPRMFFNEETWPQVKARALGPANGLYVRIKEMVDKLPDNPVMEFGEQVPAWKDGKEVSLPLPKDVGYDAMQAAFVYLVTGDKAYFEKAKKYLRLSIETYKYSSDNGMSIYWYCWSRVSAMAAYDWLYNELTESERKQLLLTFLMHVKDTQVGNDYTQRRIFHPCTGDITTGFYGVPNLLWYAGLAAYNDGIWDSLALKFLKKGHDDNLAMLEYREKYCGDDGQFASSCIGYSLGAYPVTTTAFFHTWHSATGENIGAKWKQMAYLPVWAYWNMIPGEEYPYEFGVGDSSHINNKFQIYALYNYMSEVAHFCSESDPACAATANYLRETIPSAYRRYELSYLRVSPFLLTDEGKAPPAIDDKKLKSVLARHFQNAGIISMRSGSGLDDTYCMYAIGSIAETHKHYDENNFIIYKKGFLALDTGTRCDNTDSPGSSHYMIQTVAHNCVLIHMPKEQEARSESPLPDVFSHGGMYKMTGGVCKAFETSSNYTYVAGDATACYRPEKCGLALRQFVFIMPDCFVVCDRVNSTDASYKKEWLLHTQNEPMVNGKVFRADDKEGRIFCRTMYPSDAVLTKVGGPGKEFYASGRNWAIKPEVATKVAEQYGTNLYFGKWRMEVAPAKPNKEDVFLHLMETGDRSLTNMCPATLIEGQGVIGVSFKKNGKAFEVVFSTNGEPSGHIKITSGGKVLVDRDLTKSVMPQSGLGTE